MNESLLSYVLPQIGALAPQLFVSVLAFVLGFVFRRHGTPAVLTMLGGGVLFLTMLGVTGVQYYLFQLRTEEGWDNSRFATAMSVVGIVGSCLRALGLVLIVIAVFVGRGQSNATPRPIRQ